MKFILIAALLLPGSLCAQSPNQPKAAALVNLPITIISPASTPYLAKLNLPAAARTITVCASGCNEPLTQTGMQAAINTAITDCATQTDYIQLTGNLSVSELTYGSGCTGNNWVYTAAGPTVTLPPDGQRIFNSVSGSTVPTITTSETTQAGILVHYGAQNLAFRGIKVTASTNIMDGAMVQLGDDTAPITSSQLVKNIIFDQVILFNSNNQAIRGCFCDASNQAFINSDLEPFVFVGGDAQCWTDTGAPGPILFSNNTCVGGGENIIIGASGTQVQDGTNPVASDITIAWNFMWKPYTWRMTPCSTTVGPNCGAGAIFINPVSILTSNCTGSTCEVDVTYQDAIQQDVHPLDNVVMANCSATGFNGTYGVLASPLPNGLTTTAETFSYTDTNLNSSSPGNGASAGTGCTWGVQDPSYVAPTAGGNYDIKDLFEIKECARCHIIGNIMANTWSNGQAEILQTQETNPTLSSSSPFYTPWAHISDDNYEWNWLDGGDKNGYGSVSCLVRNSVIINSVTGDSLGINGPGRYVNNACRHLGPELGNHLQFNSEWASTQPSANAQLADTLFNHNDFWPTDVRAAKDGLSFSGFTPPAGQNPFVRFTFKNNIADMTSQFGGVVIQPTGCESGGVTVACLLPAQWLANMTLGTVTGSGLGGCSSTLLTATIQPNAGPQGTSSSFCPNTTHASLGFVDTKTGGSISPGLQTVTPSSMSNIVQGLTLVVGGGSAIEFVDVISTTGSTFNAVFANSHTSTESIQSVSAPSSSAVYKAGTDGSDVGINGISLANFVRWVPSGVYPGAGTPK